MADVETYVVFTDSQLKLLKFLFKPSFRHCYVARNDYGRVWTVIEDTAKRLDVHTHLVEDFPTIADLAGPESTYISVSPTESKGFRGHLCLFTCVEVAKAYLGIKKPFIFTPQQLYRYLKYEHN